MKTLGISHNAIYNMSSNYSGYSGTIFLFDDSIEEAVLSNALNSTDYQSYVLENSCGISLIESEFSYVDAYSIAQSIIGSTNDTRGYIGGAEKSDIPARDVSGTDTSIKLFEDYVTYNPITARTTTPNIRYTSTSPALTLDYVGAVIEGSADLGTVSMYSPAAYNSRKGKSSLGVAFSGSYSSSYGISVSSGEYAFTYKEVYKVDSLLLKLENNSYGRGSYIENMYVSIYAFVGDTWILCTRQPVVDLTLGVVSFDVVESDKFRVFFESKWETNNNYIHYTRLNTKTLLLGYKNESKDFVATEYTVDKAVFVPYVKEGVYRNIDNTIPDIVPMILLTAGTTGELELHKDTWISGEQFILGTSVLTYKVR